MYASVDKWYTAWLAGAFIINLILIWKFLDTFIAGGLNFKECYQTLRALIAPAPDEIRKFLCNASLKQDDPMDGIIIQEMFRMILKFS